MASYVELQIEFQRLLDQRNKLGDRYLDSGEQDKDLYQQIQELTARIRAVVAQIDALIPSNSSGEVILEAKIATDEKSRPISPDPESLALDNGAVVTPSDTQTPTNALKNPTSIDSGTNGALRTGIQTQSTAPGASQTSPGLTYRVPGYPTVNEDAFITGDFSNIRFASPAPGGQPGAFARTDDGGASGTGLSSPVVSSLNSINWDTKVEAQPNVLDDYASYSYRASLYLIDQSNAERILNTGSKDLGNAKLLLQSGGAPQEGRSEFFNLDYYLDNIELHSFFAGKSVRLAHNVKEVKMTVVEPNGISFIQNLDAAVQQFYSRPTNTYYENDGTSSVSLPDKINYTSQVYLLVIKFYGYDDQGNLVRGGKKNNGTSDPNAFVEKFYPLIITKLNFKIASKAVEYEIHAKAPAYYINASQGRGTIPFNYEFSGGTVKDILAGPAVYGAVQNAVSRGSNAAAARTAAAAVDPRRVDLKSSAPPKANAVTPNTKTVRKGIMAALNDYQEELRSRGIIQYKDEYNVEFALDSIGSATVTLPGLNKSGTSMATPGTAADQKLPSKQRMDPKTQNEGIIAGTQIVQFIDQVLRRSSYIRDQQLKVIDNKTGAEQPGAGVNLKNAAWYRIGFKAVPKLNEYDSRRNDYAYKITYTIFPYRVYQLNSAYFKQPAYGGSHKSYQYWFTGQNTEVLSYEENLNSLYYIALTNSNLGGATSSISGALNVNELLKFAPMTASGQSTQGGGTDRSLEPAANAADQLYSPSDLKECNLTIVGDPAWLQQGEAFTAIPATDPYTYRAFLPDGTINFDAQQILFDIAFNAPRDYNIETGLLQPSSDKLNVLTQISQNAKTPGQAQFSRIYIAKECISSFAKGKFTQTLKGSLMVYYPPGSKEGRRPPVQNATVIAAPAVARAPEYRQPTKAQQPTPSAIPANPGTLGAALNALNPAAEAAQILEASEQTPAPPGAYERFLGRTFPRLFPKLNQSSPITNAPPQRIVKDQ